MPGSNITETAIRQFLQQAVDLPLPVDILLERVLEGGGHQTWYVGDDRILRLGIRSGNDDPSDIRARQKREVVLREFLNGCYSLEGHKRVIPECLALQAVEGHDVVSFCVDRRIRGTSLEEMSPTRATIDGLVHLLEVLRSAPEADMQKLGLPRIIPPDSVRLHQNAYQAWMRLTNGEQPPHALRKYDFPEIMKGSASSLSNYSWLSIDHSVFLHGDLKGEHILLNPDDGTVVGVLDWEDAGVGHAANDINGLTISVGASCAEEIGQRAGYSKDTVLAGIFLARCETVLRLDDRLNGEDEDSPKDLLIAQLQRAFEQIDGLA